MPRVHARHSQSNLLSFTGEPEATARCCAEGAKIGLIPLARTTTTNRCRRMLETCHFPHNFGRYFDAPGFCIQRGAHASEMVPTVTQRVILNNELRGHRRAKTQSKRRGPVQLIVG